MHNKIKKLIIISIILLLFIPITVSANNGVYSVTPILTEEQKEGIENYVSITSEDAVNKEFEYKISNRSSEAIELEIKALNALTSPNGVIQYIEGIEEDNSILTNNDYSFSSYVREINNLIVLPNETKTVSVQIDIPKLEGQILGGIGFTAVTKGEEIIEDNNQFTINNEMKTVVGFHVDFGNGKEGDIKFGEPFINPMPSYYAIRFPIEHSSPTVPTSPTISYTVRNSEGDIIFKSIEETKINFAPSTKTNYIIPWDSPKITKGEEYTITGNISYILNDVRETVAFDKTVTLTGEESPFGESLIEPVVVEDNGKSKWIWIILVIITTSIFIGGIVIFVLYKKKNKQNNNSVEYVLFSNNPHEFEVLTPKNQQLIDKLQLHSTAENEGKYSYAFVYTKTKDGNDGDFIYILDRAIKLT